MGQLKISPKPEFTICFCFLYLTTMIKHVFTSFSAIQIYDLSHIHLYSSPSMVESTDILRTRYATSSQMVLKLS